MPARTQEDRDYVAKLGERIRHARTTLGLSQEIVATKAGMTSHMFGKYERGNYAMTVRVLHRICQALDVSPVELMGYTDAH